MRLLALEIRQLISEFRSAGMKTRGRESFFWVPEASQATRVWHAVQK